MKKFKAQKTIVNYLANNTTPLEEEQLLTWVNTEKNKKIFKEFVKAQHLIDIAYHNPIDQETDFNEFLKQIHNQDKKSRKFPDLLPYIKYAAVLIGVFLASHYYMTRQTDTRPIGNINKAISLQIKNADKEIFNIGANETIISKNGNKIAEVNNGVLNYVTGGRNNEDVQNILTVPNGKTFKVILSDGSVVHLNSGSKLKFPGAFKKDQPREVFLEGEGFFKVTQLPNISFIVNSKTTSTKVLGTEFNVSSYSDSDDTEIVLVEGSVGVKIKEEDTYTLITPSQKATTSHKTKDLKITNVNVAKYIAWKEGGLFFENDKFETIKKILQRRYDVIIVNNFNELDKFRYNGNFKNDSIEKILNTIKLHTNFTFDRHGDTITINNPNEKK